VGRNIPPFSVRVSRSIPGILYRAWFGKREIASSSNNFKYLKVNVLNIVLGRLGDSAKNGHIILILFFCHADWHELPEYHSMNASPVSVRAGNSISETPANLGRQTAGSCCQFSPPRPLCISFPSWLPDLLFRPPCWAVFAAFSLLFLFATGVDPLRPQHGLPAAVSSN